MGPGVLRFILAFIVVIHHSFPLRMGTWAVYVFFILSGYWIARMWNEKYSAARRPVLTFIISRWWRLAPVYLTCLSMAVVAGVMMPHIFSVPQGGYTWYLKQLPIVGSSSAGWIIPPTWSLDVEMQFYLGFGIFAPLLFAKFSLTRGRLIDGLYRVGMIAIIVYSVLRLIIQILDSNSGPSTNAGSYLALFGTGVGIWKFKIEAQWKSALLVAILFTSITLVLILLPETRSGVWSIGRDAHMPLSSDAVSLAKITLIWWLIGALGCVPLVAWNINQRSNRFDSMLGNWAYPLYLFHWIPREVYYAYMEPSQPFVTKGILLALNIFVALVGSWLILKFVDSPINRIRARWVNSRINSNPSSANSVWASASQI